MSTCQPNSRHQALLLPALLLLTGVAAGPLAAQATFVRVGDMTVARNFPTAALLTDGRVLVAGGTRSTTTGVVPNKEAEIFDLKTNAFTATGSMNVPRIGASSVRLNDGRVLVLGGQIDPTTETPTAEIFDPITGRFTATGKMALPRTEAATAILKDGRVLVLGGNTHGSNGSVSIHLASELYDPTTGTFSAGPQPTYFHLGLATAVTLPDGRVLVFGSRGVDNSTPAQLPLPDVEVFDPKAGTFSILGQLQQARNTPTATLLPDGKVAVSGGGVLSNGGATYGLTNSVEVFDPLTGKSTVTGNMSEPRRYHVAVALPDGRLLLAGGITGPGTGNHSSASADLFDPKPGIVTPLAPLTDARLQAAAVGLQDGTVLIMGGLQGVVGPNLVYLQSAELFKP